MAAAAIVALVPTSSASSTAMATARRPRTAPSSGRDAFPAPLLAFPTADPSQRRGGPVNATCRSSPSLHLQHRLTDPRLPDSWPKAANNDPQQSVKKDAIQNQHEFRIERMGGPPLFSEKRGYEEVQRL